MGNVEECDGFDVPEDAISVVFRPNGANEDSPGQRPGLSGVRMIKP